MNNRFNDLYDKLLLHDLNKTEFNELKQLFNDMDDKKRKEYVNLFEAFHTLSLEADPISFDSNKVKANIINQIQKKNNISEYSFKYKKILIAAVVLLSFLSFSLIFQINKQSAQLELLSSELDKRDIVMKVMLCKEMTVYKMKSHMVNNNSAYGKVAWSPLYKVAVLQICDLPELPDNKEYQLWLIDTKEKISNLGVISAQSNIDEHFYKINHFFDHNLKNIKQFALTIENKGGNEKPHGSVTLASI